MPTMPVYSRFQTNDRGLRSFVDKGEFEAMKTLSGCRAPRCDKHQFRAKMMVST